MYFHDWLICERPREQFQMASGFAAVQGPRKVPQDETAVSRRALFAEAESLSDQAGHLPLHRGRTSLCTRDEGPRLINQKFNPSPRGWPQGSHL